MRILYVVEFNYSNSWNLAAIFTEPKEAEQYATQLQLEFPVDPIRIVKRKVVVDKEIIG